jgi:hypothetical protein
MAEAKFYAYVHKTADTGEVFYVGKGCGKRAWDRTRRSKFWGFIVAKHGRVVEIVADGLSESEAFRHEKALIALHRMLAVKLANMTDGGDGASGYKFSDAARLARNDAISKALNKPEVAARRSASISAALKGRPLSEELKGKLSAAKKGRPLSREHRLALIGKVITESHRAALKAANARPGVKERRSAAISATMKGYVKSDEHRENLSRAAKADWARRKAAKEAAQNTA